MVIFVPFRVFSLLKTLFEAQEFYFHPESGAEALQCAVFCQHAVTGNKKRQRVAVAGHADCPAGARFAQLFCAILIAARFAIGYAQKLLPHLLLEICPARSKRHGKILALSTQVFIDLPGGIQKQRIRAACFFLGHLLAGKIQLHERLLLADQAKPSPAVFP